MTVEAKSSGVQLKTKAAVTPKVPTVVEPEPKEEVRWPYSLDSSLGSLVPLLDQIISKEFPQVKWFLRSH